MLLSQSHNLRWRVVRPCGRRIDAQRVDELRKESHDRTCGSPALEQRPAASYAIIHFPVTTIRFSHEECVGTSPHPQEQKLRLPGASHESVAGVAVMQQPRVGVNSLVPSLHRDGGGSCIVLRVRVIGTGHGTTDSKLRAYLRRRSDWNRDLSRGSL